MPDSAPSGAQSLRIVNIASFFVAFPLCLAHGVLSHQTVPAVGLVPLASSAGFSLFVILRARRHARDTIEDGEGEPPVERPILIFFADAVHAAALMVVLVFTWVRTYGIGNLEWTMLATYATMPLLVNFFIHLSLAVGAFYAGFAIRDLMQYLAWQTLPPDCPNCNHRLRPDAPPPIPWAQSVPSFQRPKWNVTMPAFKAPEWKVSEWRVPVWMRRRGSEEEEQARLFVAEEERYRDEPEGAATRGMESPEPAVVIGKKKKGKSSSPILGDETEQPVW